MKAVNGTCEKWTRRSSREAIIQTACCLFAPLLFFSGYFLQFFRQCHSQSSGVGTRGPGQRKQILITGIF